MSAGIHGPKIMIVVTDRGRFRVTVPDEAKVTFGPWSPPSTRARAQPMLGNGNTAGTLRIYHRTKDNILACFSGVVEFYDEMLDIQREEGQTVPADVGDPVHTNAPVGTARLRDWAETLVMDEPQRARRPTTR